MTNLIMFSFRPCGRTRANEEREYAPEVGGSSEARAESCAASEPRLPLPVGPSSAGARAISSRLVQDLQLIVGQAAAAAAAAAESAPLRL